jgi:hypothetical protein
VKIFGFLLAGLLWATGAVAQPSATVLVNGATPIVPNVTNGYIAYNNNGILGFEPLSGGGTGCTPSGGQATNLVAYGAGGLCTPLADANVTAGALSLGASGSAIGSVQLFGSGSGSATITGGTNGTFTSASPWALSGVVTLTGASNALGTPLTLVGTNITGTAAGLTAGTVTTNANLTGPITSSGNATSIAAQTGTGTTFVMSVGPTITGSFTATGLVTAADLFGTTGTGNVVLAASPTLSGTIGGNLTFSGTLTASGLASGTQVSCLGLTSGNAVVAATGACGSGGGSGITFTDGTHTVTGSTQLTVTGGTVGGSTPNATLTISAAASSFAVGTTTITGGSSQPCALVNSTSTTSVCTPVAQSGANTIIELGGSGALAAGILNIGIGSGEITGGGAVNGALLYNNAGVPGNETIASILTAGNGIAITGTTNATITASAPVRTVTTSPTVLSSDMAGQINMNVSGGGTLTIPAISSTVFPAGATLSVVNYSASTAAVSTTPTVNAGGGCVSGTGIPSGATWFMISNGTSIDCTQTISSASGVTWPATNDIVVSNGTNTPAGIVPGSGVATALAVNVGSAGAFVTFNGAGGTPSSLTLTNATGLPNASVAAAPLPTPGSGATLSGPRSYYVCTTTCSVTLPTPAAGYEMCVMNDDNVSTVITLAAISGVQFENTARTSYKTANTSIVSGGAVGDKICYLGRDATHWLVASFVGTWS